MKLFSVGKKKRNYLALPVLFLFLTGTVSLLSACGGTYSAPSSSTTTAASGGTGSTGGSSSGTVLTAAEVTQAQGIITSDGCSGCHTLTELKWTGTSGPDLSNIGKTDTLSQIETSVATMPLGSPMPSTDVDVVSEYLAFSTGATYVTE